MINFSITIPNIKSDLAPVIKKSLLQSSQLVRRTATLKAPYKTGNLRRSILEIASYNKIEVGTNLIYAPIHEFGGIIRPKNKKALVFKINGKWIRTKKVTIPARPYLGPALEENINNIIKIFKDNLSKYQ